MGLAELDDVVETLATDSPDQAFRERVLPERADAAAIEPLPSVALQPGIDIKTHSR